MDHSHPADRTPGIHTPTPGKDFASTTTLPRQRSMSNGYCSTVLTKSSTSSGMAGMCSADPCQYHHRSLGAALCVRLHRPDPICYGDSRNRRDSGHRRAGQYPASGTGAEPQSGIRTVKILCYSKSLFSTAFPCRQGAGLTVQVRSR